MRIRPCSTPCGRAGRRTRRPRRSRQRQAAGPAVGPVGHAPLDMGGPVAAEPDGAHRRRPRWPASALHRVRAPRCAAPPALRYPLAPCWIGPRPGRSGPCRRGIMRARPAARVAPLLQACARQRRGLPVALNLNLSKASRRPGLLRRQARAQIAPHGQSGQHGVAMRSLALLMPV